MLALERFDGSVSHYHTRVFSDSSARADWNRAFVERLVKFLLWQRGGFRLYVAGLRSLRDHIAKLYTHDGTRAFDANFMGAVSERPFEVVGCRLADVPAENERPDVVSLDLLMPNNTGTEFFRRMRRDKNLKDIPIVVVSGLSGRHLAIKNAAAILEKPVDPNGYIKAISGALGD